MVIEISIYFFLLATINKERIESICLCVIQRQTHNLLLDVYTFRIYKLFVLLQIVFSFFFYRYWIWRSYNSIVPFIGHKEWQSESFTWGILQTKSSKLDELIGYSICVCYSDILPGECWKPWNKVTRYSWKDSLFLCYFRKSY